MRGLLLAAVLGVAGCAGEQPTKPQAVQQNPGDEATPGDEQPQRKTPPKRAAESRLPQTLNTRHQGRTAEAWGRDLLDTAEATSHAAAFALREMGGEALRFVLAGLKSEFPHVRKNAVDVALNTATAAPYQDVFLEPLLALLDDPWKSTGSAARLAIERCKYTGAIPALKRAEAAETDPAVKKAIGGTIKALGEVKTGR